MFAFFEIVFGYRRNRRSLLASPRIVLSWVLLWHQYRYPIVIWIGLGVARDILWGRYRYGKIWTDNTWLHVSDWDLYYRSNNFQIKMFTDLVECYPIFINSRAIIFSQKRNSSSTHNNGERKIALTVFNWSNSNSQLAPNTHLRRRRDYECNSSIQKNDDKANKPEGGVLL